MPYAIRRKGNKYEVVNTQTGEGHGPTTKSKAEKQLRVLKGVERGWKSEGDGRYTRTVNGRKIHLKLVGGKSRGTKRS